MISVKNKYVKIQNGNKEVTVHNHIYDKYLEYVNKSQFLDADFLRNNERKNISGCYIKLDEPIVDINNIVYTDFDLCIREKSTKVTGNKHGCNILYNFDSSYSITKAEDRGYADNIDLSEYEGRKIMALAFLNFPLEPLAFVDTSEFNIYIVEDESLVVLREDVFSTNMECLGIDFPYHLATPNKFYKQQVSETGWIATEIHGRLYSIGFGSIKGRMRKEYKLDNNEIEINKTDTSFSYNLKTGEKLTVYPRTNLYAGSGKYPLAEYSEREIQPSTFLHPTNGKYPLKANVRYIIHKYELCTEDINNNIIHLNQFYTMNLPSTYIGLFTVRTTTERRN